MQENISLKLSLKNQIQIKLEKYLDRINKKMTKELIIMKVKSLIWNNQYFFFNSKQENHKIELNSMQFKGV